MTPVTGRSSHRLLLRTLAAETTSGITLVSGLFAVGALLLIALLSDFSGYDPGGGNTLNLALSACFLLGPLMAGLAAMRVGRLNAQGALDLASTTPRGRTSMLVLAGVGYAIWAAVAYACFAVLAALSIGVDGPWTPAMALLTGQAIAFMSACIVLGITIGSRLSNVFIGPALTIGLLLSLNYLDLLAAPAGTFSPVFPEVVYRYGLQPNAGLLLGLVGVSVGIAILMVGLGFYTTLGQRTVLCLVGVLLLSGGASRVISASPDPVEVRSGDLGLCRSLEGIELCVWPGPGVEIDSSLRALVTVRAVISRFVPVPIKFHEEGLRGGQGSREFIVPVPGDNASAGVYAREAMLPQACSATSSRARDEFLGLVNELLRPGSMGVSGSFGVGAAQASTSFAAQRAWAAPRIDALDACD